MPKSVYIPKKSAKKPGRPTLLNPSRQATLLRAIEEGLPLKEAAEIAGISYDTLNHWTNRGQRESAPPEYRQFCQLLRRSQAVAMQVNVSAIREAAKRDWRAAAWILERRFPADFARQQQVERSGPGGKPLTSPYDDCEVLRRIKRQTGLKEIAAKLGSILLRNRQQQAAEAKAIAEAEAQALQSPLFLPTKQAIKMQARLRE